ncbi:MAG TPA: penicillin-binding protein 2 [Actinomycetota bacterium]
MNAQIRRLGLAMAALFVVLFVSVNYIQVWNSSAIANNPANARLIYQQFDVDRGDILAADQRTVLAKSVETHGRLTFLRKYPQGPLYAHITGFFSVKCSRTRLESTYNDLLGARSTDLLSTTIEDEILDRPKRGATVVTTIDPNLQRIAHRELRDAAPNGGAVVAMDPSTGEIKAMVTIPQFDPNSVTVRSLQGEEDACKELRANNGRLLLSDATDEIFPPGSTFKLVDLSAALESGLTLHTQLPNPHELDLPQTDLKLENFGGEHCAGGAPKITLEEAFVESCNVTFGKLGLELGAQALFDQATAYGFDQHVPFDIPFSEGHFNDPSFFEDRKPAIAFSAIGQQDVGANPLQMALIASAIANGGTEMEPHLVKEIRDPNGTVLKSFGPTVFGHPISPRTAVDMTRVMTEVVQRGTGTAAQIQGVTVAGKTGTAQTASGAPHAWFVCFAPAEHPTIAVAVVVLNGGNLANEATGGHVAAPIARAVIEASLGRG